MRGSMWARTARELDSDDSSSQSTLDDDETAVIASLVPENSLAAQASFASTQASTYPPSTQSSSLMSVCPPTTQPSSPAPAFPASNTMFAFRQPVDASVPAPVPNPVVQDASNASEAESSAAAIARSQGKRARIDNVDTGDTDGRSRPSTSRSNFRVPGTSFSPTMETVLRRGFARMRQMTVEKNILTAKLGQTAARLHHSEQFSERLWFEGNSMLGQLTNDQQRLRSENDSLRNQTASNLLTHDLVSHGQTKLREMEHSQERLRAENATLRNDIQAIQENMQNHTVHLMVCSAR